MIGKLARSHQFAAQSAKCARERRRVANAAKCRNRAPGQQSDWRAAAIPRPKHRWAVLGQVVEEAQLVTTQRSWLWGSSSGRAALILSFAAAGQVLDQSLVPGTTIDAELAFYPGAAPLRALVADQHGSPDPTIDVTGHVSYRDALGSYAIAIAANPFMQRWPLLVSDCRLALSGGDRDDCRFELQDSAGTVLPLDNADDPWTLAAVTGGHPVAVFGEWNGQQLRLISVVEPSRLTELP